MKTLRVNIKAGRERSDSESEAAASSHKCAAQLFDGGLHFLRSSQSEFLKSSPGLVGNTSPGSQEGSLGRTEARTGDGGARSPVRLLSPGPLLLRLLL